MSIPQTKDAINVSTVTGTPETELFSLTSRMHKGIPVHKVTTRNRDLYFALFEAALEFDNDPSYNASRGVYFVEFIADADECATVLRVARGGKA